MSRQGTTLPKSHSTYISNFSCNGSIYLYLQYSAENVSHPRLYIANSFFSPQEAINTPVYPNLDYQASAPETGVEVPSDVFEARGSFLEFYDWRGGLVGGRWWGGGGILGLESWEISWLIEVGSIPNFFFFAWFLSTRVSELMIWSGGEWIYLYIRIWRRRSHRIRKFLYWSVVDRDACYRRNGRYP